MAISDQLLLQHQELYQKAINHPLTNELCAGTLRDEILFTYLVQDLKYFKTGINFFAKTLSLCDYLPSMVTLGKQIGFISTDEHDYFDKCIDVLAAEPQIKSKVPEMRGAAPVTLEPVTRYIQYMENAIEHSHSYAELITVLYVMEQVYLGWAQLNIDRKSIPPNLEYKYKEWIDLHSGEAFTNWTHFLKAEVDRVASTDLEKCTNAFKTSLQLEIEFFDTCYNYCK